MTALRAIFHSSSPDDTSEFAARLGAELRGGDCVLLSGQIGAGKSHFARALILSQLDTPEDVPSPTFTLVQTYELRDTELWHADLYRLNDPDQIVELGLVDAFQSSICLVEWPDRLGDLAPENALHVRLEDQNADDTREILIEASDPRWASVITAVVT